jgi:hypothetical protein
MTRPEEVALRLRAQSAEIALEEEQRLTAELQEQLSRANRTCVRLARRLVEGARAEASRTEGAA